MIPDGTSITVDVSGNIAVDASSFVDGSTISTDVSGNITLIASIGDLSDVNSGSGFTDGDVLTFSSGNFVPGPSTVSIDNVDGITSVSPQDKDILIYDSTALPSPAYENRPLLLSDVSDLNLTSVTDGDVIARVSGQWENKPINTRQEVTSSTAGIADLAEDDVDVTVSNVYHLLSITADGASRVRVYTNSADRTSDAARAEGVSVPDGIGLIAEVVFTGADQEWFTPGLVAYNQGSSSDTYLRVTNKTGVTTSITVDLEVVKL